MKAAVDDFCCEYMHMSHYRGHIMGVIVEVRAVILTPEHSTQVSQCTILQRQSTRQLGSLNILLQLRPRNSVPSRRLPLLPLLRLRPDRGRRNVLDLHQLLHAQNLSGIDGRMFVVHRLVSPVNTKRDEGALNFLRKGNGGPPGGDAVMRERLGLRR